MSFFLPDSLSDAEIVDVFTSAGVEDVGRSFLRAAVPGIGFAIGEDQPWDAVVGHRITLADHIERPVFRDFELEPTFAIDLSRLPRASWWAAQPTEGWLVTFALSHDAVAQVADTALFQQPAPGFREAPAQIRFVAAADVRVDRSAKPGFELDAFRAVAGREAPALADMLSPEEQRALPSGFEWSLDALGLPVCGVLGGVGLEYGQEDPVEVARRSGALEDPVAFLTAPFDDDGLSFVVERTAFATGDFSRAASWQIYD